jgi:hypothetical protein
MMRMILRWWLRGNGVRESAARNDLRRITASLMRNFSIVGRVELEIKAKLKIPLMSTQNSLSK